MIDRRMLSLAAAVLLSLGLSGCFNRQLLRFRTHESKEVVLMESLDSTSYWLWVDHQHVFWTCAETGDHLSCTRRCGGDTDLACPAVVMMDD